MTWFAHHQFPACLHCEAKRMIECKEKIKVDGDADKFPEDCWRKKFIRDRPKPNKKDVL